MVLREGGSCFISIATKAWLGVLSAEKETTIRHVKIEKQLLFTVE